MTVNMAKQFHRGKVQSSDADGPGPPPVADEVNFKGQEIEAELRALGMMSCEGPHPGQQP